VSAAPDREPVFSIDGQALSWDDNLSFQDRNGTKLALISQNFFSVEAAVRNLPERPSFCGRDKGAIGQPFPHPSSVPERPSFCGRDKGVELVQQTIRAGLDRRAFKQFDTRSEVLFDFLTIRLERQR